MRGEGQERCREEWMGQGKEKGREGRERKEVGKRERGRGKEG
jgi:hypothetical protein